MRIKIIQEIIDFIRGKKKNYEDSSLPAPEEKAAIINEYAQKYNCYNLIETGTYLGDTIEAMKHNFKRLYSIELSQKLYKKACKRFENDIHIKLYQGDSKDVLPVILEEINEKTLFWLDGHYSAGITAKADKDTPILEELEAIYNSKMGVDRKSTRLNSSHS